MSKKKISITISKPSTKRVGKMSAPAAPKRLSGSGQSKLGIIKQLRKKVIGDLL